MTVYESVIEIWMQEPQEQFERRSEEEVQELRALRKRHTAHWHGMCVEETQESALVDQLWRRVCVRSEHAGANGYVGAFHNCVFPLLYGVFGADIITFLFDQAWVPNVTIDSFQPKLFLKRLSVLERAAKKLKNGAKTPVRLPETTPYLRSGMGPKLNRFDEKQHRLLLERSLRELRDFGELGLSHKLRNEKVTVQVHIYTPYEDYAAEILAFASKPKDAATK